MTYSVRPKALEDLEEIWRYGVDAWGEPQADTYVRQIAAAFPMLAVSPLVGKDAVYIRENYRKYRVGRHIIFYRLVLDEGIEIVRVLHERMDVDEQFAED